MKVAELTYKGLNLTFMWFNIVDGAIGDRCHQMNFGAKLLHHFCHLGDRKILLLFGALLLVYFVPPLNLSMPTGRKTPVAQQKAAKAQLEVDIEPWTCEICKKVFVEKDAKLLLCEYCNNSYCIECLQMSVSAYNVFKKSALHWFCLHCEDKVMKNIRSDREVEERCAEFTKLIEQRVVALESQMLTKVDESKVREIIEGLNTGDGQNVLPLSQSANESVEAKVKDCRDSINREANFIMYRVKEVDSDNSLDRKEGDTIFVNQFLDFIHADSVNVVSVVRLGKRPKQGENADTPINVDRPIKVICGNADQKREVLRKVSNLKHADDENAFKQVSVTHDMTRAEREENKRKLEEAKKKTLDGNDDGKYIFKVRGPPWNRRTVRLQVKQSGEEA